MAVLSPIVLVADVEDIDRFSRRDAPDVPAGEVRALVRGALRTVLRAPAILPARAAWMWQGPADARNRPPFVKASPVMLFAAPLSGGSDPSVQPLRLVSPHGQQPWTPETEATVRAILQQALKPGATGLMVTGVGDGFRTTGDVPGVSESQFFLQTEGGRPITLVVRRAPDVAPAVVVATDELVDRAQPVARQTLLWRGLACGMPEMLPTQLAQDGDLAADYGLARAEIGPCGRTLPPPR